MIGSLMYLMNTRQDIFFDVNTLSQFLTDLRNVHLIAAKHILRYLKGTIDYGSSIRLIKGLTWRVMLIQIGQAVPSIGKALQVVSLVWDRV